MADAHHAERVISHRRKLGRRVDTVAVDVFHGGNDNWNKLTARDHIRLLYAVLESFPEDEREAFLLHNIQGMTLRAIAEETDTSINTIAARVRRARMKLHDALQAERPSVARAGGEK